MRNIHSTARRGRTVYSSTAAQNDSRLVRVPDHGPYRQGDVYVWREGDRLSICVSRRFHSVVVAYYADDVQLGHDERMDDGPLQRRLRRDPRNAPNLYQGCLSTRARRFDLRGDQWCVRANGRYYSFGVANIQDNSLQCQESLEPRTPSPVERGELPVGDNPISREVDGGQQEDYDMARDGA